MIEYKNSYRQRVYQRPVFKDHYIQVLGETMPPDHSFPFEDIVIAEKHKVEDVWITITKTVEPYAGQDKK